MKTSIQNPPISIRLSANELEKIAQVKELANFTNRTETIRYLIKQGLELSLVDSSPNASIKISPILLNRLQRCILVLQEFGPIQFQKEAKLLWENLQSLK